MTTESLAQMNTCVSYKYRDGANYKFPGAVVLEGPVTDLPAPRQTGEQIRSHLHEGLYFIPGDVDLQAYIPRTVEHRSDGRGVSATTAEAAQAGWPAQHEDFAWE